METCVSKYVSSRHGQGEVGKILMADRQFVIRKFGTYMYEDSPDTMGDSLGAISGLQMPVVTWIIHIYVSYNFKPVCGLSLFSRR